LLKEQAGMSLVGAVYRNLPGPVTGNGACSTGASYRAGQAQQETQQAVQQAEQQDEWAQQEAQEAESSRLKPVN
jgi:hypothetical protein